MRIVISAAMSLDGRIDELKPSPLKLSGPDELAAVYALRADCDAILAAVNGRLGKTQRLSALYAIDEMPRSHIGKLLKTQLRERAEALAADFPDATFDIHLMPDLMECTAASDVIFTSTGSEDLLYTSEMVEPLGAPCAQLDRRMYVDISVPRNVCPSLAELPHARVFNVDDLKEVVAEQTLELRLLKKSMTADGGDQE